MKNIFVITFSFIALGLRADSILDIDTTPAFTINTSQLETQNTHHELAQTGISLLLANLGDEEAPKV